MQGLLDFVKTPEGQGLLSAVAGGLAGARRGTPLNNVGRGLLSGLQGYGNAQQLQQQEAESALNRQVRDLQIKSAQQQMQEREAQKAALEALNPQMLASQEALSGGGGPTMANASNMKPVDPMKQQLFGLARSGAIPIADYLKMTGPKAPEYKQVGNALVQIGGDGKITEAYKAPEKVDYNAMVIPDGQGGYKLNDLVVSAKTRIAEAGKPSVRVENRIENKASESVSKEVGPILEKSLTAAEGAMRVLDASGRIVQALDSGKVITGPLANARLTGLQVGQMLGVGGKDSAEIIANTRQTIRGMAEMTLQGRKEMSGQGAITNTESGLAEKATSGDIESLTAEEIRIIANASARASRYQIEKHRSKVQSAGKLPGMQNITPFFEVPAMPPAPAPAAPTGAPRAGMVQDGYRFKGGNPADPKNWEQVR